MSAIRQISQGVQTALKDGRVKALLTITTGMVLWASAFYHFVEGWSWVDSIYFSVVSISTVGFGDFSPETNAGKIFTIFYIVIGLGVFVATATTFANSILSQSNAQEDEDK